MTPLRQDLRQRPHDKEPLVRSRMRQDEVGADQDPASICNQVEVQGAGAIGLSTAATKPRLDGQQRRHQIFGR